METEKNFMQETNAFIDTNILIYLFDISDPRKHNLSKKLISDLQKTSNLYISLQVVNEFSSAIISKISKPISPDKLGSYYDLFDDIFHITPLTMENSRTALRIKAQYGFSFWDSLILASALLGDCDILYSEDMQTGFFMENTRIINPFK